MDRNLKWICYVLIFVFQEFSMHFLPLHTIGTIRPSLDIRICKLNHRRINFVSNSTLPHRRIWAKFPWTSVESFPPLAGRPQSCNFLFGGLRQQPFLRTLNCVLTDSPSDDFESFLNEDEINFCRKFELIISGHYFSKVLNSWTLGTKLLHSSNWNL
jgi:hypothetical protein